MGSDPGINLSCGYTLKNSLKKIRLVVFDVDGTLVDDSTNLREKTISVIHQLRKKNILVSLATGKTYPSVVDLLKILEIDIPVILANGAIIQWPDHKLVQCNYLSSSVIENIVNSKETFGTSLALYTPEHIYVEKETINTDFMKCIYKEKIEVIGKWSSISGSVRKCMQSSLG